MTYELLSALLYVLGVLHVRVQLRDEHVLDDSTIWGCSCLWPIVVLVGASGEICGQVAGWWSARKFRQSSTETT